MVYRSRARRAAAISQKMLGAEAAIAHKGVKEGVQVELYDRTPLPTSGKMLSSVQIRWLGRSFAVVYAAARAPYAAKRAAKKGTSPSGGHLLDMDPAAYMRAKYGAELSALKRRHQLQIAGSGVTCINGN